MASVCFITDAGNCSGDKFSCNETPGGGSGNPGQNPDYDTPQEQCLAAGYGVTSCPTGSHGKNPCPADSSYYKECVCDANMTETCEKTYYGVGPSCDGKYARCERDDDRACKEDGYNQTGSCGTLQTASGICPYNSSYYRECVCQSGLVSCTSPQVGGGSSCDGKYASCQCPSSYKICDCGGAVGATSCTDSSGIIRFSNCKDCCTPEPDETNCLYGTVTVADGCGGTRTACKAKPPCEPLPDDTNCNYGIVTVADGCGGVRVVCKGQTFPDDDGVKVEDGDVCYIIGKFEGYGRGSDAIKHPPEGGWEILDLDTWLYMIKNVEAINDQLRQMGEPSLRNDWYWTSTVCSSNGYVYVLNPYTGEISCTTSVYEGGISDTYSRYFKACD